MAKTILIVDDSPSVLAVLEDMLEELGYDVATASDGKQACQLLEANRYDLIITDLTMPVMDGIVFAQTAKQMPNCKFVPIVMASTGWLIDGSNGSKHCFCLFSIDMPLLDWIFLIFSDILLKIYPYMPSFNNCKYSSSSARAVWYSCNKS